MHPRVGGFILLSESYDAELSADFEGEGRYVLPKPVQDSELDRVLRGVETTSANKVVSIRNSVAEPSPQGKLNRLAGLTAHLLRCRSLVHRNFQIPRAAHNQK